MRWQAEDALGLDRTSELGGCTQHQRERFGGFVVGDENDNRRLGGVREERNAESAGSRGEARDTTAPSREAEMPSHTFEAIGVLNARESVANKGEDHAS
jgi:hypothetical protein